MPAKTLPPEKMAEVQALVAEYEKHKAASTGVFNAAAVRQLQEVDTIEYRGRAYDVRPVGYLDGLRLHEILDGFRKVRTIKDETEARLELHRWMREAIALFPQLVRPRGIARRLLWRLGWMPNPFANASQTDIPALLSLFWTAGTKCNVRSPSRQAEGSNPRST